MSLNAAIVTEVVQAVLERFPRPQVKGAAFPD